MKTPHLQKIAFLLATLLTTAAFTTAKSSLEKIQILAANGIWYDALTQLGDRFRQTKDRELSTAWAALLKSAHISGSDRIQNCCQFD